MVLRGSDNHSYQYPIFLGELLRGSNTEFEINPGGVADPSIYESSTVQTANSEINPGGISSIIGGAYSSIYEPRSGSINNYYLYRHLI